MKPKTNFIEVLESIHQMTDERYGQIINNALENAETFHKHIDGLRIHDPELSSLLFDTFYLEDEMFTKLLEEFRDYLKRPSSVEKPK